MADLRCTGVVKRYQDDVVLSGVDLTVAHGTMTAILGASGSGKTTLLRVIMGFIAADVGRITLGDAVVSDAPRVNVKPEARAIGYVAQEGALFPHLTVGENVGFGLARAERKSSRRITEVLELVGMGAAYERRHPHEISGGEQRRVALARALAPRPKMVLLDEPFSGLDAGLRGETRQAVLAALVVEETTSLLVTHDQSEAMSMGREVAILRNGLLAQTATPAAVYHAPVTLDVARFVGDAIVLPGRHNGTIVDCVLGPLPTVAARDHADVLVMIRPEQIQMTRNSGQPSGAGVGMPAEVTDIIYYGPDTVVKLVLEHAGSKYLLSARAFSHLAPTVGEKVQLAVTGAVMTYPPADTDGA